MRWIFGLQRAVFIWEIIPESVAICFLYAIVNFNTEMRKMIYQ